jgi:hypothetical protein
MWNNSFKGEHQHGHHIIYMTRALPFGSCFEAMSIHARLAKMNHSTRVCKTVLHPLYVNIESITPDHHVVSRNDKLSWWLIRYKCIYNFLCSVLVFTPIALCFVYTLLHFYAFSGTNLLPRCHSASSCFLMFLCFRKVTQEIFSELDETKAKVLIYLTRRRIPK